MSILAWIAVLATAWFVASIVTALVVGRYLRRCAEGRGILANGDALRPLDTGPTRLWMQELSVPRPRTPTPAGHRRFEEVRSTAARG